MIVLGIHFRDGETVISTPSGMVYRCHVCGAAFTWEEGESSWFGSWAQLEAKIFRNARFFCSPACHDQWGQSAEGRKFAKATRD